jgi:hypothetical protein
MEKLCGMAKGSAGFFLVGILGGYPVGAKCIADGWRDGRISKQEATRLLGFCSNAGPSFIFGMAGALFASGWISWALWGIQIISATIVGCLLPGRSSDRIAVSPVNPLTLPQAVDGACKSMAGVCGWVILFRAFVQLLDKWLLWGFPLELRLFLKCILELSNGCCELMKLPSEPMRFLLCTVSLSLGGLCVAMQTGSVVKDLGTGWYFPGKLLGGIISFLTAQLCLPLLFPGEHIARPLVMLLLTGTVVVICIFLKLKEKNSRNSVPSVV